jgi:omega-6 fatty acid desaturase (delta-12 desaturase)
MSSRAPRQDSVGRLVLQRHTQRVRRIRASAPRSDIEDEPLRAGRPSRHEGLSLYACSDLGRTLRVVATSVVPALGLWVLTYLALGVSYVLALILAVPTAGFLVRTYILFHDCAHGSLLRGRRANARLGAVLALMVLTPFARWRHEHAVHHATAGDLARRGTGDIHTLTVREYDARSCRARLAYRLMRNPVVMFGLGPFYGMLLAPRWIRPSARRQLQRSVWGTNLALALVFGALWWLLGWRTLVLVNAPLVALAGGAGTWLFYVQHQFDHTYWQHPETWNSTDAALRGSSYLRLPKVLQFFTGSIGLHHVHHLNTKIPSYNLQRAHDHGSIFRNVPAVSLWEGLRAVRLKLWDEDAGRLVTWKEHRRGARVRSQSVTAT